MNKETFKQKFTSFHDKNYKLLLIIPLILLVFGVIYMGYFYSQHHDFINKDISLTGGTSVTVYDETINLADLKDSISNKLDNVNVREISDLISQEQIAIIVETKSDEPTTRMVLENYLGYKLNEENSSFEFTGSTFGEDFYTQLILTIIFAFMFMGVVVFFMFTKGLKTKLLLILFAIITPILFFVFHAISINVAFILSGIFLALSLFIYVKYSIPSVAVIFSAFADIFMSLVVVNLLGLRISSAGIVAFLMLIGYSVDTDILLTNKVLKREGGSINKKIFDSFKTGILMTFTSIVAIVAALLIVGGLSSVLFQIFLIMAIGLGFDIVNTWITNVSLIKWYVLRNKK